MGYVCGDRDETINHIISECSKLAQKEYKTRHDWVDKWSTRCARNLNLTIRINGIVHNSVSVLENDTHKLLWDIQTDHIISARRLEGQNQQQKKENLQNRGLWCSGWPQNINWKNVKRRYKYLDLAWELKKLWNMKVTIIPIVIGAFCYSYIQTTALLRTARIL